MDLLTVPGNNEIHEIIAKRIDQQKQAVGIAVGVIDANGRRVITHGSLAGGDPRKVDENTIFEIGSVSKVFTSLILADMANRKEISLEDPAARYLPPSVRMPERNAKAITLLDLSTHSSGLPPLPGNRPFADDYSVDDLYEFLSGYTLPRDPGSEYEYSNLGAGLLGHVLACRAGTDYESLIRSRIAQLLGMPDTGIAFSPEMNERLAAGHNSILSPVPSLRLSALAGAGALRSSVNDMLTFLEAFLNYTQSPLAPAMKTMLEVCRPAGQMKIGLGWLMMSVGGHDIIGHNGGTPGFRSVIGFDPKARSGVVVLSNASTPCGVDDIGFHLLNPKSPLANPEPPQQHTQIQIKPELLDNYTGRYQVTPNLIFEITREGDHLFAQGFAQFPQNRPGERTALPRFELFAEGEKNFFAKVSDSRIEFETGHDGRATSLTLYKTGREPVRAPAI